MADKKRLLLLKIKLFESTTFFLAPKEELDKSHCEKG